MNCHEANPRLGELIDGELRADERAAVERHVDECAACRTEAQALRTFATRLAEPEDVAVPTEELWEAIESRLEAGAGPSRPAAVVASPFRWRPLAVAAAFVLVVGLGWIFTETAWESTAVAGQIDFRPLLERAGTDIEAGIRALIAAHGGEPITKERASASMKVRVHPSEAMPAGLLLKSMHLLNVGRGHRSLAFHFSGSGGQLLVLQCPAGIRPEYGDRECLPCQVGGRSGHVVEHGPLRLMHLEGDNACICIVSTLAGDAELSEAVEALGIEY